MPPTLLVAAGGGGDALAALFVRHALPLTGDEPPVVASFSWDRFLLDPKPGPRTPTEFCGLHQLTPRNWEVTSGSYLASGDQSTLPLLARHTAARFVLLDPRSGVCGLRGQLAELADALSATGVTLVDVGGDITGEGHEPELLSPLADAMALAALSGLDLRAQVAVAGPGLDGELSASTVWQRSGSLAAHVAQLSPADIQPYLSALDRHPSEATTLLAAAATGIRGLAEIRDRAALVRLDDQSPTIHVVDPAALLKINSIARDLVRTASFEEAEQVARALRGSSELDHERRKASNSRPPAQPTDRAKLARHYTAYRHDALSRGVSLLTFRHLAEVIGLREYDASVIRSLVHTDAHSYLSICQLRDG